MSHPMVAAVRHLRSHIPSQYAWPLLLLKGASFACIFLVLFLATSAQDEMQRERERQSLSSVLSTASQMVAHDLQDYAKWDDAVRNISLDFRPEWLADNVVAYLGRTQGYSDIFILDERNRTVFSFREGSPRTDAAQTTLGADFQNSILAVRGMSRSGAPIVSGFTRSRGRIFLFSTAAVVPLTGKVRIPGGPTRLIVIARVVDERLLRELAGELRLADARLNMGDRTTGREAIPIVGLSGTRLAWIEWTAHRPGASLRRQLVPIIAVLLLVGAVAAVLILRRGGKTLQDLRRSELRARHLSEHDSLTGLPNRRALIARLAAIAGADVRLALLFMDLDGFKDANDVYGHGAGDDLLRQTAARISKASGEAFVCRTGGDEFAVLLVETAACEAERVCDRILGEFRTPFGIGSYQVRLGVSIGLVAEDAACRDGHDELLRRADVAMYAAKSAGKNCAREYQPVFDEVHLERVRLEADLRTAIETGSIYVLYQPIVDARTGVPVAVEALARWSDPVRGEVSPDVFIPIAEMGGLINALGRQVLRTACAALRGSDLDLAVNLSPAQFWDGNLLEDIRTVLAETGFPPERLELEITESLMLRRPQVAAEVICQLRSRGIRIALDDFGTGFASIGYLKQLPLDRLKVDKGFIAPLDSDPQAREMLNSIAGLGRACSLEVCAEGVESEAQARIAELAGCARLQGWYFGRPQTAEAILSRCKVEFPVPARAGGGMA